MLYVKITKEESIKIGQNKTGLSSGKRNKENGERELIYFCSNIDFIKSGIEREKEFIEI